MAPPCVIRAGARYIPPVAGSVARLEVVAGKAAGMSILVDDELLIGRHADGAGRLADDEEISRSHARLSIDRSGFCAIEDLGSTNGTYVNGLRISGPQTISEGDTIEVGGTTLVVRDLPIPRTERTLRPATPRPAVGSGAEGPGAPTASELTPVTIAPEPEAAAEPPPEAQPAEAATRLTVQLEVDFDAREATIVFLDGGSDPLRLVFDGKSWRPS